MHPLIELHNVETPLNEAKEFVGGNILVTGVAGLVKSIFKFDIISVCEVFGYQIASAVGVRVPRMQGFWTQEIVKSGNINADPGRIGVLIEYHKDWTALSRDCAAARDSVAVTRALTLCAFDWSEWGEFGLSGDKLTLWTSKGYSLQYHRRPSFQPPKTTELNSSGIWNAATAEETTLQFGRFLGRPNGLVSMTK